MEHGRSTKWLSSLWLISPMFCTISSTITSPSLPPLCSLHWPIKESILHFFFTNYWFVMQSSDTWWSIAKLCCCSLMYLLCIPTQNTYIEEYSIGTDPSVLNVCAEHDAKINPAYIWSIFLHFAAFPRIFHTSDTRVALENKMPSND